MQQFSLMVRLEQVRHSLWKGLSTIQMTHREVLFQDQWKKYLGIFRVVLTSQLHLWLEHPICKFTMKTFQIYLKLIEHLYKSEKIKREEYLLKVYLNGQ